jgi:hypothetical protein
MIDVYFSPGGATQRLCHLYPPRVHLTKRLFLSYLASTQRQWRVQQRVAVPLSLQALMNYVFDRL